MALRPTFLLLRATMALALVAAAAAARLDDDDDILLPFAPSCSTADNYTAGSPYQTNLAELLARMPAAAGDNGWFYNGTAGAGSADQVFGLIMCYADRNAAQCADCLARAPAGAAAACPGSRSVSAAFDACLLRYSDAPFSSSAAGPGAAFYVFESVAGGAAAVDLAALDAARSGLMDGLARAAADAPLRLANGSAPYGGGDGAEPEEVYGLAQCTRDLTAGQCAWCLTTYAGRMGEVFGNATGGATKGYSCYVRYRIGAFEVTLPPSPRPALPPSPSSPQPAAAYP